jgi:hypothetical protein
MTTNIAATATQGIAMRARNQIGEVGNVPKMLVNRFMVAAERRWGQRIASFPAHDARAMFQAGGDRVAIL